MKNNDVILHDHNHDGIDRRGFLKCMAWAGTGALCMLQGGVLKSYSLSDPSHVAKAGQGELSFVQISDSHMGFNKPANHRRDRRRCKAAVAEDQCAARAARVHAAHRRHQPPLEARGVRHR